MVERMTRQLFRTALVIAALCRLVNTARADSATLAWDRAASHTNLAAFVLKYGVTSGSYTGQVDVATNLTSATVNNLVPGVTYYFVVTAKNVANLESDPSNQISYTVPGTQVNAVPVATSNSTSTSEDQSRSITLAGTDSDGDPLTFSIVTSPGNGTLTGTVPNVTYRPNTNFSGSDSFTFRVNDGRTNSATATISITVNAVNDSPTLNALSTLNITEDSAIQTVNLSGIGSGAANEIQTLTLSATSSNPSLVPNPTVTYTSPNSTGSLAFRPATNTTGTVMITVTINDGQSQSNTTSRTFNVVVSAANDAPTISDIANRTVAESTATPALAFTISDQETAAASLTLIGTSSNTGLVPNGNIVFGGSGANRNVTVTPTSTAFGSAVITVRVTDANGSSVTDTFTLTVTPVNQAPTLNALSNLTIAEDAGQQTVALSGITTGATNEIETLTVTATSSNPSLIAAPTVSYASPSSSGSVSFPTVTNATGAATITVTVSDGQALSSTFARTFTVTVTNVNDRPTISDLANQTVNEGSATATLPFTVGDVETAASSLTVSGTSSNPTLIPNADVVFSGSGANRNVKATPATTQFGSSIITVIVTDSAGATAADTFTVTVTPVNQPPTLNSISNLTLSEDAAQQTINLAGIGTGAANETDTLIVTATSSSTGLIPNPSVTYTSPNATGTLRLTPVANASGSALITVTVNDGQSQSNTVSRTFTVTVNSVNDTPTLSVLNNIQFNEDSGPQTINLSGISSGAANESETLTITATSSTPSLIPNPTLTYTSPNSTGTLLLRSVTNATGTAVITVTVNDGQSVNNTVTRTFNVTVLGLNDAPTISSIADQVVDENTPTALLPFSIGDTETPAASLVVTTTSSNHTLVPTNNIVLAGTGANRTVVVTPAASQSGSAVITLVVADGTLGTATEVFTVTVSSVNQPPTLDLIGGIALNEDAPTQTVDLAGISTGAFNELQTLTVTATSSNPSLIPTPTVDYTSPNFSGTLEFTPVANASGSAVITVTVTDGQNQNNTTSQTFLVTVNPVNDAPNISNVADQTINQNTSTATLAFTIGDAESTVSSLTVAADSSAPTLVPNANIVLSGTGSNRTVRVTPAQGQAGSAIITITVADGTGGVNRDSFLLTVNTVNFPPTLDALSDVTVVEDNGAFTVNLTGIGTGSAGESQSLIITAVSSDTNLFPNPTVTHTSPNATGTLAFTPLTNAFGAATITVTVSDGQPQNSTITRAFTVTVNAVNDTPTLNSLSNLIISQNSPPQSVPLLGITFGASNENQVLTVTATSSNPDLIPNPTVTYATANLSGSLTLTSAPNAIGTATITVLVDDGESKDNLVVRSFTVTVIGANAAPTITDFPDRTISMNGIVSGVSFTIGDAETSAQNLRVTVTSSNPSLVRTNDIAMSGTGSNRLTSIVTTSGRHGYTVITYTVHDTQGASSSDSFVLTVVPPNTQPTLDPIVSLVIGEDSGPHVINLTSISAGGSDENQTLIVSALSASPSVIPHPTIQYTSPDSAGTLTFAPASNVTGSATIIVTVNDGQNRDYLVTRTFVVTILGTNDAPAISSIPNQVVQQNAATSALPFILSDPESQAANLTLAASSSDQSLIPNANIVLRGSGANRTITITPELLHSGVATITIFASDGALVSSTAFQITVGSGNTAPVVASQASLNTDSYTESEIPVTVADQESNPDDLVLTAASFNTAVLPDANITFSGSGSNRVMKCKPVPGKSGNVTVNIGVSDGKATARTMFQLNVQTGTAPTSQLSVRRNGRGTVKPALDGQLLVVGKTYTISAIPASDELFVRWSRGATSRVPAITFVMVSNLVLEVTFTNNPYLERKGLYNGLFYETAEVRQPSSGSITVTPTDRGTYSGKLRIGITSYSISGSLDLAQKGTNSIPRKGTNALTVELDFGSSSNQAVGRVTDGFWEASLMADRSTFNAKTNPCPQAGTYTLILPGQTDAADGPEGDGFGTIKVDGNGMASLIGTLADGTKVSTRTPLSAVGQWPVYASVPGGTILSWMNFIDRPTDDLTGLVSWIKTAQIKTRYYPGGFTNETIAVGSSFVRPTDPNATLLELTGTTIAFSAGNLSTPFSNDISWGTKNKITNLGENNLSLTVNTTSGLFNGTVTDPITGRPSKFGGALLQKQNVGSGFMLGTNLSSLVLIGDQPAN